MRSQLKERGITVHEKVTLTKIDYLRRVLFFKSKGDLQKAYEVVYCLLGEGNTKLLSESLISNSDTHPRLLHNKNFDSIYMIGSDFLPTTFSL